MFSLDTETVLIFNPFSLIRSFKNPNRTKPIKAKWLLLRMPKYSLCGPPSNASLSLFQLALTDGC